MSKLINFTDRQTTSKVFTHRKITFMCLMCVCIGSYCLWTLEIRQIKVLNFPSHIVALFYTNNSWTHHAKDKSPLTIFKPASFRRSNNSVRSLSFSTEKPNSARMIRQTEAYGSLPVFCQPLLVPSIDPRVKPGLANNMWIYASAYSIARYNGMMLKLRKSFDLASAFKLDYGQVLRDEEYNSINWLEVTDTDVQTPCCKWMQYHEDIFNLSSVLQHNCSKNVRLNGYFQSWYYFQKYEKDIRRQFTFDSDVSKKVQNFLVNALTKWETDHIKLTNASQLAKKLVFVGIHVRLGDWLNADRHSFHLYIRDAMSYFAVKFPHVCFVVCSNDIGWCRGNVGLSEQLSANHSVVFSEHNDRVTDLAILSKCNHSIITLGTYGWWSAYLAGGITLYYHRAQLFIGRSQFTTNESHYFYPGWIPY